MAQRWTIDLNNGAFVFEPTTKFTLHGLSNIKENGQTESFDTTIDLEGVLVGDAPDPAKSSRDKHIALRAQWKNKNKFRVQLKLDGVTVPGFDFQPARSIGTPKIRELKEISGGAGHATHVKFALSIFIREGGSNDDVTEFEVDSNATFYNDRLLNQTWMAKAKGVTLAKAKAFVDTFKPGITPLLETHHQSVDSLRYETTWSYDKTKGAGITKISESVSVKKSGHPIVIDPRVGDRAAPALFKGRFRPSEITITFNIEGTSAELIKARPLPHFVENKHFHRDTTRETELQPTLFDSARGIYSAQYSEFWIGSASQTPQPSHKAKHDEPFEEVNYPIIKDGIKFK